MLYDAWFIVDYIILGSIIGVFGIAGDLFESFIKRCVGIKDMGNIFPGIYA
jgi:CDP-diglyceride synthetase